MFSYEENVRAILQCFFSQSKDELIEGAVKSIMAIKQESTIIYPTNPLPNPIDPGFYQPFPPITTTPATIPATHITCKVEENGTK